MINNLIGKTLKTYTGKIGIIKQIDPPFPGNNFSLNWLKIEGDNGYSATLGIDDQQLKELENTNKTPLYQII